MSKGDDAKATSSGVGPAPGGEALWYGHIRQVVPDESGESLVSLDFVRRLRESWKWLMLAALVGGAGGFAASFVITPKYKASTVVAVSLQQSEGIASSLGSRLGGLANLAGIAFDGQDKTQEAIAVLASRALADEFILKHSLSPVLFASLWDPETDDWKKGLGASEVPTAEQAYLAFSEGVRSISEDRRTNLVTVSMRWKDAELAAAWANDYVALANAKMRERALTEVAFSLSFLLKEAESAESIELRQAIFQLVETQKKQQMLASVRPDFAFRVIDPAKAPDPDNYSSPNRPMIAFAGLLAAMIGAAAFVVMRKERAR